MIPNRPIVIVSGNQKGGVGKSTNALNIGAGLGEAGKRVLLIDSDAESSLTRGLGFKVDEFAGFLDVVSGHYSLAEVALHDQTPENVSLVPASPSISSIREELQGKDATYILRDAIALLPDVDDPNGFDFIIVDTPPSAGSLQSLMAYTAANFVLLSVLPSASSFDGMVTAMRRTLKPIQEQFNPELDLLGLLVSNVDTRSTHWETYVAKRLEASGLGHLLFRNRIRQHGLVRQCEDKGISVFQERTRHYKNNRRVVEDYRGVVAEILYRLENLAEFLDGELPAHEKGHPENYLDLPPLDRRQGATVAKEVTDG